MDGTPIDTTSGADSTSAGAPTLDDLLADLPGSREGVDLFGAVLRIMTAAPPTDDEDDTRPERIQGLLEQSTSAGRARTIALCTNLGRLCDQLGALALQVKAEQADPDVVDAAAVVTPDGWLVVTLAGADVARIPFNPERASHEAQAVADHLLREYVALQVSGTVDAIRFTGDVFAGRRGIDLPPAASSRPDPIPVRKLRQSRVVQ